MPKMKKELTRQYFDVKDAKFGEKTAFENGVLTIAKEELKEEVSSLMQAVSEIDFEIVRPGENCRIIHLLDTIQPMIKTDGEGQQYSGFFGDHGYGERCSSVG